MRDKKKKKARSYTFKLDIVNVNKFTRLWEILANFTGTSILCSYYVAFRLRKCQYVSMYSFTRILNKSAELITKKSSCFNLSRGLMQRLLYMTTKVCRYTVHYSFRLLKRHDFYVRRVNIVSRRRYITLEVDINPYYGELKCMDCHYWVDSMSMSKSCQFDGLKPDVYMLVCLFAYNSR